MVRDPFIMLPEDKGSYDKKRATSLYPLCAIVPVVVCSLTANGRIYKMHQPVDLEFSGIQIGSKVILQS